MTYQPVTIWHNSYRDAGRAHSPMLDGFETEYNRMTPVFTYTDTGNATAATAVQIAGDAYELFNVGHELGGSLRAQAERYRLLRLRSLSVGDLVQVGRRYLAVEKIGFRELTRAEAGCINVEPVPVDEDPFRRVGRSAAANRGVQVGDGNTQVSTF